MLFARPDEPAQPGARSATTRIFASTVKACTRTTFLAFHEGCEPAPHETRCCRYGYRRVASWRVTTVLVVLFQQAPAEPSVPVSVALGSPVSSCIKPLSSRLPCVDISMTILADYKGFSMSGCHHLLPGWLFPLPFDLQVSQFSNMVDFDVFL